MNPTRGGGHRLTLEGITHRFGEFTAVQDINLDISGGELVALLGPSGCGKSTLLRIIAGFIAQTQGSVLFDNQPVDHLAPNRRGAGIVFQNYALFPHMTVGENVAFPLRARRLPKSTWAAKVAGALAMVELGGYEERRISQMSGGQRQRVALARAIVFEPRLILMDEPLSALDKQLRETMQIELRHLHKKLGATTIYVTHDQREALTMSDRVAILRNGRMVQVGSPDQLHDRPVDSFVASFIGEATLLPVTRASHQEVRLGGLTLRSARALPPDGEILLAVQTEKLLIDDGHRDAHVNRLPCRVTDIVYQGDSLRIFAALEDGTCLSLRQPSHHAARKLIPLVGECMTVILDPEDTVVVRK
jgi:putative spermidine/putrescine transport system ATP-binding protein